jgi:hypothetical protein
MAKGYSPVLETLVEINAVSLARTGWMSVR